MLQQQYGREQVAYRASINAANHHTLAERASGPERERYLNLWAYILADARLVLQQRQFAYRVLAERGCV